MSPSASRAELLVQRALQLLDTGSAAEAARTFRAAIAADERHLGAHYGLVQALRQAGRLEGSIAAALALSVADPHDPRAHATLALALRTAGHIPEAEAAAQRARLLEWKRQLQPEAAANPLPGKPEMAS